MPNLTETPTTPTQTKPARRQVSLAVAAVIAAAAATIGSLTAVTVADRNAQVRDLDAITAVSDVYGWHGDGDKRLEADLAEACRSGIAWTCGLSTVERDPIVPETLIVHSDGTLPPEQIPDLTHADTAARVLTAAPVGVTRVLVVSPAGILGTAPADGTNGGPQL